MDYRSIIESKYNRTNWQKLLYDIFRQNIRFWQQPIEVSVDENMAKTALYIGQISLPDGHSIAVYEVELSDKVIIERNRAGIRNLLCTNWRGMGCAGAFMFCYRQNESVLRFSYVSEALSFTEDGSLKKESTDTKRFTYLLGEGHRSRTAIEQFEKLKKSSLGLKDVTKAFSVEALSDSFFKEYKKQYEDIVEFVTGKRMIKGANNKWKEEVTGESCAEIMREFAAFPDAEKAVRDYVKKLMGRLVFIQFLQKKGWMGCPAGEAWKNGDSEFVQNLFANTPYKETFVDDVLEPLFNDINTKRPGDLTSSPHVGVNIKIPYLNGGLFENDDYDSTNFPLPAKYMKSMLDFFASYNFTIDENDPDDAEIGVDPEMLGRIFENLLEDNKDKGAFYTPKEIVQYMCRESLIAYLQTDITEDAVKDSIRQFVTSYDVSPLDNEQKQTIDKKLKEVKICDPAIGSGAFPMGLLRELYACRKAIEGIDDETAVGIKTHIIQNNIYGVDIEKGAVDIARLRFWLALIVDEQNPHALPNMDFKIMQGNSLLEQYEGVDLSGMSLNEQLKKKSRSKKQEAWQQTFAFDERIALDNIQHAIHEYYLTDDHATKINLRSAINENVRSYILNLKGCTSDIQQKLENLPIPNDQFFLWHIYFKDVFDKGGFDIVIGNPPYINAIELKKQLGSEKYQQLKKCFTTAKGATDFYVYFFEKGLNLLCDKGCLCYITPNKYLCANYAVEFRKHLIKETQIISFWDVSNTQCFNASVYPIVTHLRKTRRAQNYGFSVFARDNKTLRYLSSQLSLLPENLLGFLLSDKIEVINSLIDKSKKLIDVCEINATSTAGEADKFHDYIEEDGDGFQLINTGTIDPYVSLWGIRQLTDKGCKYLRPTLAKSREKIGDNRYTMYNSTKIIFAKMAGKVEAFLDEEGEYASINTNCIHSIKVNNKLLLGWLHSKVFNFIYDVFFDGLRMAGGYLPFSAPYLSCMYYPQNIDSAISEVVISLVDHILSLKKENPYADTSALEAEIDQLVYQLYGLTDEEIAIIENSTN